MTNSGLDITGGSGNKFGKVEITIDHPSGGKGIILKDTSENTFDDIVIFISQNPEAIKNSEIVLDGIKDDTINPYTNESFKSEVYKTLQEMKQTKKRSTLKEKLDFIVTSIKVWSGLQNAVVPDLEHFYHILTSS